MLLKKTIKCRQGHSPQLLLNAKTQVEVAQEVVQVVGVGDDRGVMRVFAVDGLLFERLHFLGDHF